MSGHALSVVVHCSAPGCTTTVCTPWPEDEWWKVDNDEVALDGRAPLNAPGWTMPGPRWLGDPGEAFCPQHAPTLR